VPRYEVYATRWDDPHIVEELIPARGLSFSLPLSDHGEASFEATVEPGRSFWRPSIGLPVSGILIARDGVPVWSGWVRTDRKTAPRTFQFTCQEWGGFFEDKCDQPARTWTNVNDHQIFRDLVTEAQAVAGQNLQVQVDPSTSGASVSTRVINAWDTTTVGREFRSLAEATGGPEWYFGAAGTLDNPVRQLVLGDRLGHITAQTVLEFVEDTEDYRLPDPPPTVALLSSLYLGDPQLVPTRRAGGNLIDQGRVQDVANAATYAEAVGSGEEKAQKRKTATATTLLAQGWPRMTYVDTSHTDVSVDATLQRHADAALADRAGIATDYHLVSFDGDLTADWTQTPRGSTVGVVLDTDEYGGDRPVGGADGFDARLVDTIVHVPDDGTPQVEWVVTTVLEV
jgi:hypothetical protein